MNTGLIALSIVGMGLITYAIRLSLFLLPERVILPPWLLRGLRYVPAAVLTAIIAPELFQPGGTLDVSLGNDRLLAGLVAILIAWRTRNVVLTVAIGLILLWLLQTYNPF
ncbi:Branched-chain amino acid transport [Candidatus Promineifilum breve]|uniref:Branched-chain amino acid transport n=1 Tax=Candidatus Promineifilum breve TaxID=1806508 RepID=A0A170PDC0_9CHLR|nr:AzlD domain-containing protein [Candidatus Promineifilum breve]CUS01937.1 Branched-chain amino acid transport [Candidatus Promineifilum breve]